MALQSKNSRAGGKKIMTRNKFANGGEEGCLPRYNGANCGALWKSSKKHNLNWGIKSKKRCGIGHEGMY